MNQPLKEYQPIDPIELGDHVKAGRSQQGEVVQLSGNCARVLLQHPLGDLWWFNINELEKLP